MNGTMNDVTRTNIDFEIPKINSSLERRMSVIRGRRGTLINIQRSRGSIWSISNTGKKSLIAIPTQYENSYRLAPNENEKFMWKSVQQLIQEILNDYLSGMKYDSKIIPDFTKLISDRIKRAIKDMSYSRFKLVCLVFIGDKSGGNVSIASRCLLHRENGDTMAEAIFDGDSMYAVATIYGFYFE